jgi:hypothetical protein
MATTTEKTTKRSLPPGKQTCICPNCGYSRSCLDPAICQIEMCPLCGVPMTLEPRPGKVA